MSSRIFFNNRKRSETGAVLLIVLILMALVASIVADIIKASRYDYSGAAYLKNSYVSNTILESAADTTIAMFRDRIAGGNFADFEKFRRNYSSILKSASSVMDAGELTGKIEDESSRLPLNMESKSNSTKIKKVFVSLLFNLCDEHNFGAGDDTLGYANEYANSLLCWIGNGTLCNNDRDYYRSLDPEYDLSGKHIQSIDELLLIRRPDNWLDDEEFMELYNGSGNIPGLKDLVTPYSKGPMNINTLKKEIVMSLIPVDRSVDEKLNFYDDLRDAKESSNNKKGWFAAFMNNQPPEYRKNLPELSYVSDTVRVTIRYKKGIYSSSLMEIFNVTSSSNSVKYKKYGH